MKFSYLLPAVLPLVAFVLADATQPTASSVRIDIAKASGDADFQFEGILPPAINDVGAQATFAVISGNLDRNSAKITALNDGKVPANGDDPRANCFFEAGNKGGRLTVDLGKSTALASIATYSWHNGGRSAQRYHVYASNELYPANETIGDGWVKLASVDSSEKSPGQHAVRISSANGNLGSFRYLLFDVAANPDERGFGNTFFSEIDVLAVSGPEVVRHSPPKRERTKFATEGDGFEITLDSTDSPDLLPWFKEKAIPAIQAWYPKVAALISVPGRTPPAPKKFDILLKEGQVIPGRDGIPAYASGDRIVVSSKFMRDHREGEALGCLIHEMVHIVQFGAGQRAHRSVPTWFFEGATDYIRWYLFEPQSKGTTIRNPDKARYSDSYRVTANFIDWATKKYDKDLIVKIHEAVNKGYSEGLWKDWTGKPVEELEADWKQSIKEGKQP